MNSRANRKLRLAETARQRETVLREDSRRLNGAQGTIVFIAGRPG